MAAGIIHRGRSPAPYAAGLRCTVGLRTGARSGAGATEDAVDAVDAPTAAPAAPAAVAPSVSAGVQTPLEIAVHVGFAGAGGLVALGLGAGGS